MKKVLEQWLDGYPRFATNSSPDTIRVVPTGGRVRKKLCWCLWLGETLSLVERRPLFSLAVERASPVLEYSTSIDPVWLKEEKTKLLTTKERIGSSDPILPRSLSRS